MFDLTYQKNDLNCEKIFFENQDLSSTFLTNNFTAYCVEGVRGKGESKFFSGVKKQLFVSRLFEDKKVKRDEEKRELKKELKR